MALFLELNPKNRHDLWIKTLKMLQQRNFLIFFSRISQLLPVILKIMKNTQPSPYKPFTFIIPIIILLGIILLGASAYLLMSSDVGINTAQQNKQNNQNTDKTKTDRNEKSLRDVNAQNQLNQQPRQDLGQISYTVVDTNQNIC